MGGTWSKRNAAIQPQLRITENSHSKIVIAHNQTDECVSICFETRTVTFFEGGPDQPASLITQITDARILSSLCFLRQDAQHQLQLQRIIACFDSDKQFKYDYTELFALYFRHAISHNLTSNQSRLALCLFRLGHSLDYLERYIDQIVLSENSEKSTVFINILELVPNGPDLFSRLFAYVYDLATLQELKNLHRLLYRVTKTTAEFFTLDARKLCVAIIYYYLATPENKIRYRVEILRSLREFATMQLKAGPWFLLWRIFNDALAFSAEPSEAADYLQNLLVVVQLQAVLSSPAQFSAQDIKEPIWSVQVFDFYPEKYLADLGQYLVGQLAVINPLFENTSEINQAYTQVAKVFLRYCKNGYFSLDEAHFPNVYPSHQTCTTAALFAPRQFILQRHFSQAAQRLRSLFESHGLELLRGFNALQTSKLTCAQALRSSADLHELPHFFEQSMTVFNFQAQVWRDRLRFSFEPSCTQFCV